MMPEFQDQVAHQAGTGSFRPGPGNSQSTSLPYSIDQAVTDLRYKRRGHRFHLLPGRVSKNLEAYFNTTIRRVLGGFWEVQFSITLAMIIQVFTL